MKVSKIMVLGMVLACGLAAPSFAQTVGYNKRTGDVWVDNRLGEINDYGRQYRDPFVGEMTGYYGAPRPLVVVEGGEVGLEVERGGGVAAHHHPHSLGAAQLRPAQLAGPLLVEEDDAPGRPRG